MLKNNSKRQLVGLLMLSFLFTPSSFAEVCWTTYANGGDSDGYASVKDDVYNADGDISHTLRCDGAGTAKCVWPDVHNYPGPNGGIVEFVPKNHPFCDAQGNLITITGNDINLLIHDQCVAGNYSGRIVVANGLATFTFTVASDFSSSIVKHLEG